MAELTLAQNETLTLRARAHSLAPVVLLGAAGLSEAALKEIDRALAAHGLVKVRAGKAERPDLDTMFQSMAERLGAARIQAIGHTFVLFRPIPDNAEQNAAKTIKTAKKSRTTENTRTPTRRSPTGRGPQR